MITAETPTMATMAYTTLLTRRVEGLEKELTNCALTPTP